ncbi:putative transcriptional regulator, Crp/Fnr family [Geobacter metallireducens RCH3]|uniref:Cyclic nucleotide-binding domain protein n=2 Tax=Geobacter metallireducens (strain ATCC 53774 / DSM 7210 / GS-15) TaxID=269799 RepID=Q39VF8_GEOMG|nr:cyclic nucleotide-binding domain-containing protein [Geobacter metallireducens]ABB31766.1 cyclic nucleotide-binding domain protein [Geobacter metallireducens GS-15]EHP89355.1 putative transcriptional regulator, Crp/Fnr family [Geobacter metallireducens RCH3]
MISPERLRVYRFFASLTDEQLKDIALISEEKSFPTGSVIFKENSKADNLMLLLEGGVELFYSNGGAGSAANSTVCSVVPGAIFGVSSLIKPYHYTSSARATKPVRVVDINGARLREMSENNQALGQVLMNNVAAAVLARLH